MEEKQSRSSRFASLPGVAGLLFFAVLAEYFRAWLIAAFFFLLFLLCAGSLLWSRQVLRRAQVRVTPLCRQCHVGEELSLELSVRNRSFFPVTWLDVILPTGEMPLVRMKGEKEDSWFLVNRGWKPQTGLRDRFVWILWQQEITWTQAVSAIHRGVVDIPGAQLAAGDGFGLSAGERWLPFDAPLRLAVYPRLAPVQAQPFMKTAQEAVARNRGQTEDITVLKNIRPYQPGDPAKKINWRMLASGGRMEVNVYETVTPGCMTFLLDLDSFRLTREQDSPHGGREIQILLRERELEQMISLVASCMREISARQIPVALILPAYGKREAVFCLPEEGDTAVGQGEEALERCMTALAEIGYRGEESHFPYEEFWQIAHRLGNLYLCVRTDAASSYETLAGELGRGRVTWLAGERRAGEAGDFACLYRDSLWTDPGGWTEEKEVVVGHGNPS